MFKRHVLIINNHDTIIIKLMRIGQNVDEQKWKFMSMCILEYIDLH